MDINNSSMKELEFAAEPYILIKELKFTVEPYIYSVKLFEGNILQIEVIHKEEYLIWFNIFDENIKTGNKITDLMKMELRPKIIFDILSDFSENKVSNDFKIVFPNDLPISENSQLMLEIHVEISYGFSKIIPIYLNPKVLEYKEIVDKKLLFFKNSIKNMETKIEELSNTYESFDEEEFKNELIKRFDEETKIELLNEFKKMIDENNHNKYIPSIVELSHKINNQQEMINSLTEKNVAIKQKLTTFQNEIDKMNKELND